VKPASQNNLRHALALQTPYSARCKAAAAAATTAAQAHCFAWNAHNG